MKEQQKLNIERVQNPQPGDYWEEMLIGICVVLEVTRDYVIICSKKFETETFWVFDFNHLKKLSRKDFIKFLSYETIEGTWANVWINHTYRKDWLEDYNKKYKGKAHIESKSIQLELFE